MLIAFHKPFGVLSQFTSDGSPNRPLAEFNFPKNVYPIGRLDADSEGLLLLSDEPQWNEKLLHPRHAHEREYWAQVEKIPARDALGNYSQCGVVIQGRKTLPCRAWLAGAAARVSAAHSADPLSQARAGLLDRLGTGRRQKSPGAADDGGHRPSDVAVGARAHRKFWLGDLPAGQWRVLTAAESPI